MPAWYAIVENDIHEPSAWWSSGMETWVRDNEGTYKGTRLLEESSDRSLLQPEETPHGDQTVQISRRKEEAGDHAAEVADEANSRDKHLPLRCEKTRTDIRMRYTTAYHLRGTFTIPKILRNNGQWE